MTDVDSKQMLRDATQAQQQADRAFARQAARDFVEAVRQNDLDGLAIAGERLNESVGGWTLAFPHLARRAPRLDEPMRIAFWSEWTWNESLRLRGPDDQIILMALRRMMPSYEGPSLHLYRGARAYTTRRRRHGMSWTVSVEVADTFARSKETHPDGGGVLLKTPAPSSAIVCSVEYQRRSPMKKSCATMVRMR